MSNTELLSSCDKLSLYPLDIPSVALHFTGWAATTQRGPQEEWHVPRASLSPSSTASQNPCQHSSTAGWSSQPLPCLVMKKNNQEGCVTFLKQIPSTTNSLRRDISVRVHLSNQHRDRKTAQKREENHR